MPAHLIQVDHASFQAEVHLTQPRGDGPAGRRADRPRANGADRDDFDARVVRQRRSLSDRERERSPERSGSGGEVRQPERRTELEPAMVHGEFPADSVQPPMPLTQLIIDSAGTQTDPTTASDPATTVPAVALKVPATTAATGIVDAVVPTSDAAAGIPALPDSGVPITAPAQTDRLAADTTAGAAGAARAAAAVAALSPADARARADQSPGAGTVPPSPASQMAGDRGPADSLRSPEDFPPTSGKSAETTPSIVGTGSRSSTVTATASTTTPGLDHRSEGEAAEAGARAEGGPDTPPPPASSASPAGDAQVGDRIALHTATPEPTPASGSTGSTSIDMLSAEAEERDLSIQHQIGRAVIQQVADGDRTLHLRLTPPALGTVRIELTESNAGVMLRFQAEDEQVRQIIERQLPQIRQEFRQAEQPIRDVELDNRNLPSFQEQDQPGQHMREQLQDRRGGAAGAHAPFTMDGTSPAGEDEPSTPSPTLGGLVAEDRVDYRA